MGHRTAPHTPGYQKCIHRGSVQPGGCVGGRLVSPAAHPLLGSPLPPFYKHTSMEPLSGFLLSFQMCTKVSSAAERS